MNKNRLYTSMVAAMGITASAGCDLPFIDIGGKSELEKQTELIEGGGRISGFIDESGEAAKGIIDYTGKATSHVVDSIIRKGGGAVDSGVRGIADWGNDLILWGYNGAVAAGEEFDRRTGPPEGTLTGRFPLGARVPGIDDLGGMEYCATPRGTTYHLVIARTPRSGNQRASLAFSPEGTATYSGITQGRICNLEKITQQEPPSFGRETYQGLLNLIK